MFDRIWQDARIAARMLRRSPGFMAAVVITLGLGIGANTAMFDVVDRLMLRPLGHLRDPHMVHRFYWQVTSRGIVGTSSSGPYTRYRDLRKWTTSFSQYAAFSERPLAVGEGEAARERRVATVTASYFEFFDARPVLGRYFTAAEDATPRGADVAVLSYDFWRAEFGERDVVGELLSVGNVRATIIGVAPEGFDGVDDADPPAVYIPITTFAATSGGSRSSLDYYTAYDWGWVHTLVRRRHGVTVEQATADASQAFRRSWEAQRALQPSIPPADVAMPRVVVSEVRPGAGPTAGPETRTALWVTGVAVIVLLIACANVANLFLARALRRERETAVRLALGVTRGRLFMQSMTESLLLALLAGIAALIVAQWAGAAIRGLLVDSGSVRTFMEPRTLAVMFGLTISVAVAIGIVAALAVRRSDPAPALRAGSRGGVTRHSRLRATLLIAQSALSVVLLVGAVLFVRSLRAVEAMPVGYDAEHVLLVNRMLRGPALDDSALRAMRFVLLDAARALPGVEAVAWRSSAPFISTSNTSLYVAGIDSVARLGTFTYQATTEDYFRVMGSRILRGRGLSEEDRQGAPNVAVVSESMARVLWPGQDALGQCFRVREQRAPCTTVVGIAEDMVQRNLLDGTRYHFYLPIEQFTRTQGNGMLVRVRGDPLLEGENIRRALMRVMPGSSYLTVQPLRDILGDQQRSWRLGATMFVAFGALAVIVAAVGLYGVIGYEVDQRRHELGVRVALGAQRHHLLRMVVGRSLRFAIAGALLGSVLTLVAGPAIQPLLYRQSVTDPLPYAAVGILMILVALVASAKPANRASKADPNIALRAE